MPTGAQHRKMTRAFLGYDIPWVHLWLDLPARYLGSKHRVLRHNLSALEFMESLGPEYAAVAMCHILQDARVLK